MGGLYKYIYYLIIVKIDLVDIVILDNRPTTKKFRINKKIYKRKKLEKKEKENVLTRIYLKSIFNSLLTKG